MASVSAKTLIIFKSFVIFLVSFCLKVIYFNSIDQLVSNISYTGRYEIGDLLPDSKYRVNITIVSQLGEGNTVSNSFNTCK